MIKPIVRPLRWLTYYLRDDLWRAESSPERYHYTIRRHKHSQSFVYSLLSHEGSYVAIYSTLGGAKRAAQKWWNRGVLATIQP